MKYTESYSRHIFEELILEVKNKHKKLIYMKISIMSYSLSYK